jgi:hypothetical protein
MSDRKIVDEHSVEEDFPLSGGSEDNFKYPKIALLVIVVLLSALVLYICHSRGMF